MNPPPFDAYSADADSGPRHVRESCLLAIRWFLAAFCIVAGARMGWRAASIGLHPARTLADIGVAADAERGER